MTSIDFQGVQRIKSLADYPASPSYGAAIYKNDIKKFLGFYEDSAWQYLAPAGAPGPGTDTRVATVIVAADGSGDYTDIQDGIDALPAAGGLIYIKDGTYEISVGIVVTGDNIVIQGHGPASIIKIADENDINSIEVGDVSHTPDNVKIYGLKFDGNKANQSGFVNGRAIYLANDTSNVEIDHNIFVDHKGYVIEQAEVATTLKITNNYYSGCDTNIQLADVTGFDFSHNYYDCASYGALLIIAVAKFNITDNYLKSTLQYGAPLGTICINNCDDGNIDGNIIDDPGFHGIYLMAADNVSVSHNDIFTILNEGVVVTSGNKVVIEGNNVSDCRMGIYVNSSKQITIKGNNICDTDEDGMYLTGMTDSIVSGNNFKDNGNLTNNTYDCIKLLSTSIRNVISGNDSYQSVANKTKYMIDETNANCTSNLYSCNRDTGSVTAKYRLQGAASYTDELPIGSIYIAIVSTDPATLLGYGTWAAIAAGRVLVGLDSGDANFDVVEETGGAKTVASSAQTFVGIQTNTSQADAGATGRGATASTLTLKAHVHPFTPTGTNTPGAATSVVQPYFVVYMWKRTA
jgi:parallel beta-helix repeat protein